MNKAKILILMLMALLVSFSLCQASAPQERTVVVSASAVDRGTAVKNALCDAVGMVTGVDVSHTEVVDSISEQRFGDSRGEQSTERANGHFRSSVRGYITTYSVLEEKKEGGLFHVKLSVAVALNADDSEKRPTIAIAGIKLLGANRLETPFAESLRQSLARQLLAGREYCLLDRKADTAFFVQKEQALRASDSSPASEVANLGRRYAAKYLVVLYIHNFEVERWRGERDLVTRKRQRFEDVTALLSWEIITSATGVIAAGGTVEGAVQGVPVTSRADTAAVLRLASIVSGKLYKQIAKRANNLT